MYKCQKKITASERGNEGELPSSAPPSKNSQFTETYVAGTDSIEPSSELNLSLDRRDERYMTGRTCGDPAKFV